MKELDVPVVIKIDTVRNVTNKPIQGTESGIESEILLPSSTCTVSKSLSCEQFVGIIVNNQHYNNPFYQKLESIQYNAVIAITGAIRGSSTGESLSRIRFGILTTTSVV